MILGRWMRGKDMTINLDKLRQQTMTKEEANAAAIEVERMMDVIQAVHRWIVDDPSFTAAEDALIDAIAAYDVGRAIWKT